MKQFPLPQSGKKHPRAARFFGVLFAVCMAFTLLPMAALATALGPNPVSYQNYADGTFTEAWCNNYTTVTNTTTAWGTADSETWYVVSSTVTIDSRITVTGDVHLILADDASLTASAGITVEGTNSLTIYGQTNGTGKLTAYGGTWESGIGSFSNGGEITSIPAAGAVTINGGTVNATSLNGAGIGGGCDGTGGSVTINGGTVTATSYNVGAGIGGGGGFTGGGGGSVAIHGGTVTATSSAGAGIGGGTTVGSIGAGGTVQITGGNVNAAIQAQPTNGSANVYKTTYTENTTTGKGGKLAVTSPTYNLSNSTAIGGVWYVYLPEGAAEATYTKDTTTTNLAATVTTANTAEFVIPHNHCVCGGSVNVGDHTSHTTAIGYTPINNTDKFPGSSDLYSNFTITPGSYYLTEDITVPTMQFVKGTVNICLNGHKITTTAAGRSILQANGPLNLCDCKGGGTLTDTTAHAVSVGPTGTFHLYGGTITESAGGVYNDGTFKMYGGAITGNGVTADAESPIGGGVYNYGTFKMYGGSITDNIVLVGGTGGGVANYGEDATLSLSGKIEISGNKAGTASDNVALIGRTDGDTFTYPKIEIGALTNTVPIGVSIQETTWLLDSFTPKSGEFTSGTAVTNSSYAANFTSDRAEYKIVTADTQLKLTPYIKSGENQNITVGGSSDLTVTSSADIADFERVEVGKQGQAVSPLTEDTDFTKAAGSTIITLKNSYLKTLAAGTYTMNIVSTTGTVSTTFTITAAKDPEKTQEKSAAKPAVVTDNTLNAWVTAGGNITPGGKTTVKDGANVTYTITPNAGYKITDVKVDGVSVGAVSSYTFSNIYGNHEIGAYFDKAGATATKTSVTVPATGDTENLMLYAVLAVVSLLGLGTVGVMARKKRRNG